MLGKLHSVSLCRRSILGVSDWGVQYASGHVITYYSSRTASHFPRVAKKTPVGKEIIIDNHVQVRPRRVEIDESVMTVISCTEREGVLKVITSPFTSTSQRGDFMF
jgi:hypothetical protein